MLFIFTLNATSQSMALECKLATNLHYTLSGSPKHHLAHRMGYDSAHSSQRHSFVCFLKPFSKHLVSPLCARNCALPWGPRDGLSPKQRSSERRAEKEAQSLACGISPSFRERCYLTWKGKVVEFLQMEKLVQDIIGVDICRE